MRRNTRITAAAALSATALAAAGGTMATPALAASKAKTVTGPSVTTPFGPVQVKVTVKGKQLTKVSAIAFPQGGKSSAINSRAIPALQQQAMTAQSAFIDGVSGASWSSYAFATSLQKALAQAGIS